MLPISRLATFLIHFETREMTKYKSAKDLLQELQEMIFH